MATTYMADGGTIKKEPVPAPTTTTTRPRTSTTTSTRTSSSSSSSGGGGTSSLPIPPELKEFVANIDEETLRQLALTMLEPSKLQAEKGYADQLADLLAGYENGTADVTRQYDEIEGKMGEAKEEGYKNITTDAARRGLYWSTAPTIQQGKLEQTYAKELEDMLSQEQYTKDGMLRDYNNEKGKVDSAINGLAALIEAQAAAMMPDLKNDEWQRQYQTWQGNNGVQQQNYQNQMDQAEYQERIRQFNAQLAAQRAAAAASRSGASQGPTSMEMNERQAYWNQQIYNKFSGFQGNDLNAYNQFGNDMNAFLGTVPQEFRSGAESYWKSSSPYSTWQDYINKSNQPKTSTNNSSPWGNYWYPGWRG